MQEINHGSINQKVIMKKLALIFVLCLAYFQSTQAATTALTESILEYQAITNFIGQPNFTTIGPSEFIVDIARITRRIDVLGIVEYSICTRQVLSGMEEDLNEGNGRVKNYIATLNVTANPGIGPNIVTVLSIVPCT